ncbi:MAG: porin, partial [Pseudomonadota bacterium]
MTRVLWTTASAVALAWGCGAAAASDIQLSDRIFLETEGFFAPSYTTGGDQEGLFALGELQGKGYYIIKPGYLLGGQVRAETVMLDDDLDAQTEIEQAFAFYATPLGDVSVGKFAGMTGALVYGAPSAIGRGYGVNFPEFVPVDNPFLAPFSSSSSPTFFDTDPRIALNTPIYNDYIIGISYAPEVETIGTNEIEDVVEIAGLKRFALGGVDLGLSAGVLTGNTNSGSTFGREFFNDNVWATNFGFDLVYGNLNVGGSAVYYENLDGFDDISLTAYTLGATYQFGPLTAGLAYGLATTDLPETGDSANLSFGDAQTEQIEASLNYALVPGIDIGLAVVHMDRSDDRFG